MDNAVPCSAVKTVTATHLRPTIAVVADQMKDRKIAGSSAVKPLKFHILCLKRERVLVCLHLVWENPSDAN